MPENYQLTSTTGLTATAPTPAAAVLILTQHLLEHLPAGAVGWTVTSPNDLVHEGRLNLNGNTHRAAVVIANQMSDLTNNLHHELAGSDEDDGQPG